MFEELRFDKMGSNLKGDHKVTKKICCIQKLVPQLEADESVEKPDWKY